MAEFAVKRVILSGPQLIGARRVKALRGRVGAQIVAEQGVAQARLNDFRGISLEPSLNPDAYTQTFVCGPVIERAQEILAEIPQVATRLQPGATQEIDFSALTFGLNRSDVMFLSTIKRGGEWSSVSISNSLYPFENISLSPVTQALHYGQAGFEGAKAYRSVRDRIVGFRLPENAKRHQRTSARLALTPIPEQVYLEAVRATVLANQHLLAPPGFGASMYIRPLHFGSGAQLGVAPAPSETLMIFVSPVGPYFKGGFSAKPMLIEEHFRRSAPGLMGDVKVAGNYAGSILPGLLAKARGFAEAIYLDVASGANIEEVGAANAFFVLDGTIYTPGLSGTILPGITRDSLITLAIDMGIKVIDNQPIPLNLAKKADEAFCSGTAAVVTPISSITIGKRTIEFNQGKVGPITQALYTKLNDIQEERIPDHFGWVYPLS